MDDVLNYFQLGANAFALTVAGWIYFAYIKNLNSTAKLKDEQIKSVEKNIALWKDRISDLEKKSPENIEKILNDRIKIREEEIKRFDEDKENHKNDLNIKNQELLRLKSEVEKAKNVRKTIGLLELELDDEIFSSDAEYDVVEIGLVAVDSGQLMITDPSYIDTEWVKQDFEDLRFVKDKETSKEYQFRKDFNRYDEIIDGFDKTVNELIESNRFEEVEVDRTKDISYSYAGACYTTLSDNEYGELPFKLGHEGAGVVVSTYFGDGIYPVYGERYDGKLVRVYFDLA